MAWCVEVTTHVRAVHLPLYAFFCQIKFGFVLSDSSHVFRQTHGHMCPFGGDLCALCQFGLKFKTVLAWSFSVTSGPHRLFGHIYNGPPIHMSQNNFNLFH